LTAKLVYALCDFVACGVAETWEERDHALEKGCSGMLAEYDCGELGGGDLVVKEIR
jgi:hypothetical protein